MRTTPDFFVCQYCRRPFPNPDFKTFMKFCSHPCRAKAKTRPPVERFWEKVRKTEGCWFWEGAKAHYGYGRLCIGGFSGPCVRVHRYSWELHYGPIPDGLEVCHRCDTPACVRPDHLWLGTHAENMADRESKGRGNRGRSINTRTDLAGKPRSPNTLRDKRNTHWA